MAMTLASVGRRATPTRRTAPSATHTTKTTRGGHGASGTAAPVALLAITVGRRRRHETRRREGLAGVRGRELPLSEAVNSAGISGSALLRYVEDRLRQLGHGLKSATCEPPTEFSLLGAAATAFKQMRSSRPWRRSRPLWRTARRLAPAKSHYRLAWRKRASLSTSRVPGGDVRPIGLVLGLAAG